MTCLLWQEKQTNPFSVIKEILETFSTISGLIPIKQKSNVYFTRISEDESNRLSKEIGMQVGRLPIRYIGVLLITSRLFYRDYLPILEKT